MNNRFTKNVQKRKQVSLNIKACFMFCIAFVDKREVAISSMFYSEQRNFFCYYHVEQVTTFKIGMIFLRFDYHWI